MIDLDIFELENNENNIEYINLGGKKYKLGITKNELKNAYDNIIINFQKLDNALMNFDDKLTGNGDSEFGKLVKEMKSKIDYMEKETDLQKRQIQWLINYITDMKSRFPRAPRVEGYPTE